MDKFRELRMNKVTIDMSHQMSKFIRDSQSQEEVADVFRCWITVLGASIGTLGGADEGGIDHFLPHLVRHFRNGYNQALEDNK